MEFRSGVSTHQLQDGVVVAAAGLAVALASLVPEVRAWMSRFRAGWQAASAEGAR